jgi:hypothetical protein
MINKVLEEIKLILEKTDLEKDRLNFSSLPKDEAKVFLISLNNLPRYLINFVSPKLDKNEIQKWALAYLALHNLWHSEINHQDIAKLEIFTTTPIFHSTKNILSEEDLAKLSFTYFLLGFSALKINHSLDYLISEKLILGEFVALGGIEKSIWGLKFKPEIIPSVAKNIQEKTEKDRHHFLLKKYKNLVFDFLTA